MKGRCWSRASLMRLLLILVTLFVLPANKTQAYSGYVGESIYLPGPSAAGIISTAAWISSEGVVYVSGSTSGATAIINSYFSGTATIECHYTYQYYDYSKQRYTYSSVQYSYYYITCKASTLTLNQRQVTLKPGESVKLTYTNSSGITPSRVTWSTSDYRVASFDGDKQISNENTVTVTAEDVGECVITCEGYTGNTAPTCKITVKGDPPTAISLPATATTKVGSSVTLTPTLTPSDAYTTIKWISSDEAIATVSGGKVTGKNVGTVNITATTDNNLSATTSVTVEKADVTLSADTESGVYAVGKTVTLKASKPDADIYYTLDGSSPTTSSTRYTAPITLNKSVTLKAIATGSNYITSSILTRQYTVTTLTVKSSWTEEESQTPYFVPSVTFSKSINKSLHINDVMLTQDDTSISGQPIVQDGILYFVTDSPLSPGSYTLKIPGNAVVDTNEEPNLDVEIKLIIKPGVKEPDIVQLATTNTTSFILKSDGTVWAWGSNSSGMVGDGTTTNRSTPVKVLDDVVQISAEASQCYAVKADGTLWAWGYNSGENVGGWLGDGTWTDRHTPVKTMDNVAKVIGHFAIKTDGTLWAWGSNSNGRLGDGTTTDRSTPVKVLDDVAQVLANGIYSLAIKNDGTLWAWGENSYDNTTFNSPTPVKVLDDVAQVAAGYWHILALKTDGTLWPWGRNISGQLGDGTTTNRSTPVKVLDNVAQVLAESNYSLALKTDGTLWAWGSRSSGELGDGSKTGHRSKPFKLLADMAQVATSNRHTLAIKKDGTLWAWGYNSYGQLGDGTKTIRSQPVKVLDDVARVAAGSYHTLALKTDGTLWAWGYNKYGQLGDGTTTDRTIPVCIIGESPFKSVTGISLPQTSRQIAVNEKCLVLPTVTPANSCIAKLSYESSNPQVAAVSQRGIVEGKSVGTATITVTVDGTYTATFTVQVQERTMRVTTSSAGYATFYDSQAAFSLPNGLTAQVVTAISNNKLTYQSLSGSTIPKGIAVMLVGSNKQATTYTLTRSESTMTYNGANLLYGSDEGTTTTGDGYHYKLSYGPSSSGWNNVFGWYWGGQNGAPFQIEGHKAWLVVPKSSGSRGYAIDSDATGIGIVDTDEANDSYYDLQGRRINTPIKNGVYIHNGRKVVVK